MNASEVKRFQSQFKKFLTNHRGFELKRCLLVGDEDSKQRSLLLVMKQKKN